MPLAFYALVLHVSYLYMLNVTLLPDKTFVNHYLMIIIKYLIQYDNIQHFPTLMFTCPVTCPLMFSYVLTFITYMHSYVPTFITYVYPNVPSLIIYLKTSQKLLLHSYVLTGSLPDFLIIESRFTLP